MTNEPNVQAHLINAAIHEILHGTMPDGSPIQPHVKIDAILAVVGIDSLPSALRSIIGRGINQRRIRRGRCRQADA